MSLWRKIEGFSNYSVSSSGRIRNNISGKILSNARLTGGYERYILVSDSKERKNVCGHRIVAIAFIENPLDKKEINHKDGDKRNNSIENLEWATSSENQIHAYKNGLQVAIFGSNHTNSKLSESKVREIRRLLKVGGMRQADIAKRYRVHKSQISSICTGTTWAHVKDVE